MKMRRRRVRRSRGGVHRGVIEKGMDSKIVGRQAGTFGATGLLQNQPSI
jgi:hypothetical protein